MSSTTSSTFTTKIADLAAVTPDVELSEAEARSALDTLLPDQADLANFLSRKALRLPERQQHALLRVIGAAKATTYAPALAKWAQHQTLSLRTRALAVNVLARLDAWDDSAYHDALQQAEATITALQSTDDALLDDAGELTPTWRENVCQLPLDLALDAARDLSADYPQSALAILRAVQPQVDASNQPALVDRLAGIAHAESAAMLQALLEGTTDKATQKSIKKALHRLKAQGVEVGEVQPRGRSVVGTVSHRLERCLASHIDPIGDRVLWLIRTKPFGGYNIAYVIINYGTGIKMALGLPATKRELPELLAKAQENAPLIDIDPAYCQFQVAQAYQMNLDTGSPVPEEYFSVRDIIGEPDVTFDQALIYSALSEDELAAVDAYETHAADLLALPEFGGWTLPAPIIQKYGDQLHDIEESNIVVSQSTKGMRVNAIYEQALEETLGEESRRLMRLRIEETAYYLLQTNRRREALWAVAAARSLETDSLERLRRNPFAGALLERSLEGAKRSPSRSIILPFSNPTPPPSSAPPEEPSRIII